MSNEIQDTLLDAWDKIWPHLKNDPDELASRLARRRTPALTRPVRAWCLAVRAADHRINPATACIVPEDAAYPHSHVEPELRPYLEYAEHTVTLDATLLKRICRPVQIEPGGQEWTQVAEMLGVHPNGLYYARARGVFKVRYISLLGGKRGKPVPILSSPEMFDPSSKNLRQPADPVWCAMWTHLANMVPKDFEQTVTRVPVYYGERRRDPTFRRWLWVCPSCAKKVWTVYYPIPPITLPEYYKIDPAICDADEVSKPPPCFACHKCHHVRFFSRVDPDAWNCVVSYLSGGLLYGHEVKRPEWFTKDRKREYKQRLMSAPSKRCEQVLERILKGWKYARIARELGIKTGTVNFYARKLYLQYGLHSRKELEQRFARMRIARSGGHVEIDGVKVNVDGKFTRDGFPSA